MQVTTAAALRNFITLLLLGLPCHTYAADTDSYVSAMRYVSLDAQGDNADSRQFSGTGSFTLGNYTWLQGSVGRFTESSADSLGDLQTYGIGGGLKGEHLQLSLNFNSYSNDASYKQRDVIAALDWYEQRFNIGLDLFRRSTHNTSDIVRDFPTLNRYSVMLHVDETLTGNGIGAHASFNLTDALSVSLGGMSYSYDSDYTLTSSNNPTLSTLLRNYLAKHPTASEVFYLNNSGVTRSLALLDSSYNLGLSYVFDSASLSAQYFRDKGLDSDAITHTLTLSSTIFIGDHWMATPQIGQSRSDDADDITFGGLSLSYNW